MSIDRVVELAGRLVVGRKRDGRSIYDPLAKLELIELCRHSDVSLAKLARASGINANQLSSWIRQYEQVHACDVGPLARVVAEDQSAPESAFIPVEVSVTRPSVPVYTMDLCIRLPNGVVIDLRDYDPQQFAWLLDALGGLRCSASMQS
jgi:transposase